MEVSVMFTRSGAAAIGLLLAALAQAVEPTKVAAPVVEPPKLGKPLDLTLVTSITIWPDGKGLPVGSGNAALGESVYEQRCQACHGQAGVNGINGPLVGGQVGPADLPTTRTVGSYWPYATSLFDYVRRAMPYREPGSLSNDELYAVVAYLLFLNGVIEQGVVLDAATLSKITLPNRQRFYSEYELP